MTKNKRGLAPILSGFSLFEMLVVILIMGILGVVTTQIILISLRSSTKSESTVNVRENLNHVTAIMERELRNATSVSCPTNKMVTYKNVSGKESTFSCLTPASGNSYVASDSARMTTDEINVTNCTFVCDKNLINRPSNITITLGVKNTDKTGTDAVAIDVSTKIYLRNY